MVRNAEIWALMSIKGADLLMIMNRVVKLRIVQKWAVLSSNEFDLLILRNRVLRL